MSTVDRYQQGTPCYVELTTPDPAGAKAFYGGLFGWEFADVDMGPAGLYVPVSLGGEPVAGIAGPAPDQPGRQASWGVYLAVDDVDAASARVAELGGVVEAGPLDVMGLGRMSSVRDPSGVSVSLWQAGTSIGSVRVNEPGAPIWHELTSPDLPAATTFYAELLGVAWESLPMEVGDDYTCLIVAGRPVAGAFPPQVEGEDPRWDVYLNVTDCDRTVARAVRLGGAELVPAYDLPGVGRVAMLRDPQGAAFALMQNRSEG